MNERIRALRQQRFELIQRGRALLDAADGEHRSLNADEEATYRNIEQEIDSLDQRIQQEERQYQREQSLNGAEGGGNPGQEQQPGGENREARDRTASPEYRTAILRYLAGRMAEQVLVRDSAPSVSGELREALGINISGGDPTEGGVLAPTELERTILDFAAQYNVMRRLATVRTSANNIEIPVSTGKVKAYHLDEGQDFTESNPTWDKIPMGAFKIGALSKASHEALEDIFIDLEAWIQDEFGWAFAELEEEDFITGDGAKKPRGVLLDASAGITAAAATVLTADELIDLQHALPRQYRANAAWMMHDDTVRWIRKLKDANGQYLWQASLQAGKPDTLLGHPLETSEHIPTIAADAVPALYGDFSRYRILDRRGLFFQRLSELFARSGQVGFLAYKRYDGRLLDPNAVKKLTMGS